jgi:hypothetical protein
MHIRIQGTSLGGMFVEAIQFLVYELYSLFTYASALQLVVFVIACVSKMHNTLEKIVVAVVYYSLLYMERITADSVL